MTHVPAPVLGATGFAGPNEADILAGVLADLNDVFGGDLNPSLETPQGQLAVGLAALLGRANDLFAYFVNQVDPAYSLGRMQDGIARIYFLSRTPAEPTTVSCNLTGLPGTIIPVGALAVATDGNIYSATAGGIIPASGFLVLPFACTIDGPIPCPATTLQTIYRAIPGWDGIVNLADGVEGNDVESREAFELRRAASVSINAAGTLPAIRAAILNVRDVLDAYVTENFTASPISVGGVTIAAKSIYACVSGGAPADVARAIWTKKNPGCGYTGGTTVTVYDTNSGYTAPYPAYNVSFQTAASLPIALTVQLATSGSVPSNAAALVKAVALAAFTGGDGGQRARIGSTLYASRFYSGIAALGPWVQIAAILIGSPLAPAATVTGSISGAIMTVTAITAGALAVGQTITGAGVLPGTRIVAYGTGSGGTGSYTVSVAQSVAGEALTAVLPALASLAVPINYAPTLDAADVTLALI